MFCSLEGSGRMLLENELAVCIADAYTVSEYHSLVIPRRHVVDGMAMHQPDWNAKEPLLLLHEQLTGRVQPSASGTQVELRRSRPRASTCTRCRPGSKPKGARASPAILTGTPPRMECATGARHHQ